MITWNIVFLSPTYFTKHNNFQVHPYCCKWQNFIIFLWLSNIPVCVCVCVCVSHLLYPFICWWARTAMNIKGTYLFKIVFSFSLDIYPGVGLFDHMVVLFLVFWENFILFSIVAVSIYISTNSVLRFPFSAKRQFTTHSPHICTKSHLYELYPRNMYDLHNMLITLCNEPLFK